MSAPPDQLQQLSSLPPAQQGPGLIRLMGLDQFFSQRGLPPARIASCLADDAALQRLGAVTQRASTQESVNQTPTFILNGNKLEEADWPGIEARLRSAIGG